jgi:hypothetical protein
MQMFDGFITVPINFGVPVDRAVLFILRVGGYSHNKVYSNVVTSNIKVISA